MLRVENVESTEKCKRTEKCRTTHPSGTVCPYFVIICTRVIHLPAFLDLFQVQVQKGSVKDSPPPKTLYCEFLGTDRVYIIFLNHLKVSYRHALTPSLNTPACLLKCFKSLPDYNTTITPKEINNKFPRAS